MKTHGEQTVRKVANEYKDAFNTTVHIFTSGLQRRRTSDNEDDDDDESEEGEDEFHERAASSARG